LPRRGGAALRRPLVQCARFERVWTNHVEAAGAAGGAVDTDAVSGERGVSVWRPQAPAGYAALGDCVTPGARQPSFQARLPYPYPAPPRLYQLYLFVGTSSDVAFLSVRHK